MVSKVFFKSKDGLKLCGAWHQPNKATNKAIVLAHGITVNKDEKGIFIKLAELLIENGFAVFRFDFRGHGESDGESVNATITGELFDMDAAIDEVRKKGYQKIGLLGASFGGGIAALYSERNQKLLKALILWNPCLNYDHTFLNPITLWLKDRNEEIKADLKSKGWTTIGSSKKVYGKNLFREMQNFYPYKALLKIALPTLIVHGTSDKYVPYEDSKQYVNKLKNGRLVTIEKGEHGFQNREEDGELVREATLNFLLKYL